ncbi:proprotein convertase P-domain-containing protein [Streptomyces sp. NPDC097617]|uniref:proprotein convertase P-domain-containing protein n=1 Tax=Streptomyces sp. NPDC097617 TaxID=3366091 RepID=UPI0037F2F4AA
MATWNMQGASSASDSKWTTTVALLAVGGNNRIEHDVVALQEAGPRSSLPGTVVRTGNITVNGRQATYQYEVRRWRVGSTTRGRDVYITWLNTDPTGNRNNVAIVSHEDPGTPRAIAARQANNSNWGMRPALGIQLSDGSQFWSFHASSNGDNRSNDAQNMLVEIASASAPGMWAVLGDFNRRPDNLTVPPGSQIYSSGSGTQQGGGELDYMVSNDRQTMTGWSGRRLNGAGSDHYAIEFAFRAAANFNVISSVQHPDKCLQSPDGNIVTMDRCNSDLEELFYYKDRDLLTDGYHCLAFLSPESNPARPAFVDCTDPAHTNSTKFKLLANGTIIHLASNYCLDTSDEWGREARLWWCNTTTWPANQNFVNTFADPYQPPGLSIFGPATGTEDAATAGSGTTPPPDSCLMPANPQLDPCKHISKRSIADVPVLDQTTAESPLQVHGQSGYAPTNLAVGVDIKHTHRGNLVLSLVAPNNSVYPLEDIADSDSNDHVFKSYTVNASTQIANGTWKLRVQDVASGNFGTIDAWNLTFPNGSANTSGTPPILDHHENFSHAITSNNSGSAPTNLGVSVYLTHPRRGDLVLKLYGPSGRSYPLEDFTDSDTTADVYKNYTVNASSETGTGMWRLSVTDITTGNTGTIDAWGLSFPRPSPF